MHEFSLTITNFSFILTLVKILSPVLFGTTGDLPVSFLEGYKFWLIANIFTRPFLCWQSHRFVFCGFAKLPTPYLHRRRKRGFVKQKTLIANTLEIAGAKARYNSRAKKLFANKVLLAWIVKYSTKEFRDYSVETIMDCIEGEPEISKTPVCPGKAKAELISGMATVDDIPNEGEITYDILFYVMVPSTEERIKMIINLAMCRLATVCFQYNYQL